MANLRAIRKRIVSVRNTRQITKAMKLVSAAKLRRATEAAVAARPYSARLKTLLTSVSQGTDITLPLLETRAHVKRVIVVAFSSDRGLCGSFNGNVARRVDELVSQSEGRVISVITVGRKVREHARRRQYDVNGEVSGLAPTQYAAEAYKLTQRLVELFLSEEADEVLLVYQQFKSALTQILTTERLLPFSLPTGEATQEAPSSDFLFEPDRMEILEGLLPQVLASRVMQAFLESAASEHGARMTAMDSATRNASEMIEKLTLEYNRARQAAITKELVEIVSGAEAL